VRGRRRRRRMCPTDVQLPSPGPELIRTGGYYIIGSSLFHISFAPSTSVIIIIIYLYTYVYTRYIFYIPNMTYTRPALISTDKNRPRQRAA